MKFGVYFPYWEHEWNVDSLKYVGKVAKLGFDVIEIAAQHVNTCSQAHLDEIARLRPRQQHRHDGRPWSVASEEFVLGRSGHQKGGARLLRADADQSRQARRSCHLRRPPLLLAGRLFQTRRQGGRPGARSRGHFQHRGFAANCGVNLCLEVLNRFENHVLNTAEEGVAFVREVGKPNVKVHLDTFHMNIEEDSFGDAIRAAGPLLGHFHVGENNRRVPGKGRLPWHEIGNVLREIGYDGAVVLEPFVTMGGGIGSDIKVWRDLSDNADEAQLDEDARRSLAFCRYVLG